MNQRIFCQPTFVIVLLSTTMWDINSVAEEIRPGHSRKVCIFVAGCGEYSVLFKTVVFLSCGRKKEGLGKLIM
jgi:hypothetical protein